MGIRKNSEDVSEKTEEFGTDILQTEEIKELLREQQVEQDLKEQTSDQMTEYDKYINIVYETRNEIIDYCNNKGLTLCENLDPKSLEEFFNTMYSSYL
jgi:hypothetical protein